LLAEIAFSIMNRHLQFPVPFTAVFTMVSPGQFSLAARTLHSNTRFRKGDDSNLSPSNTRTLSLSEGGLVTAVKNTTFIMLPMPWQNQYGDVSSMTTMNHLNALSKMKNCFWCR
jgi:hypothetical protein